MDTPNFNILGTSLVTYIVPNFQYIWLICRSNFRTELKIQRAFTIHWTKRAETTGSEDFQHKKNGYLNLHRCTFLPKHMENTKDRSACIDYHCLRVDSSIQLSKYFVCYHSLSLEKVANPPQKMLNNMEFHLIESLNCYNSTC